MDGAAAVWLAGALFRISNDFDLAAAGAAAAPAALHVGFEPRSRGVCGAEPVNYLGVLSVPAENALLARYSPAHWRATAFGAKFLLALGVSTIGVKLVAMIYDGTGSFAPLWLTLAGCAGFVAIAGMFLPGPLLRMGSVPVTQPAE